MLLLLSAIGICGIFADERINGTDQIIFSSVSKEKLFIAKIMARLSMAKSGMNPKMLQYIMGHSDISVTMNTYTHVKFQDAQEDFQKAINS